MNNDLPLARRDIIALRLDRGEGAVATALAHEFGVSEDAIRRDLRALAAEGRCRRVYGGALPLLGQLPISAASTDMAVRMEEHPARKAALARAAAALVQKNDLVFLDNGSTNLAIVRYLPRDLGLTLVTNSIQIAAEAGKRSDVALIVLGGAVDPHVGGFIDAQATQQLMLLNLDRAFLGVCALSASGGISAFYAADASFKRTLLAVSAHVAVLAINDKLETRAPYRIADIGAIDQLIVEHDAPAAILAGFAQAGATLLAAPAP